MKKVISLILNAAMLFLTTCLLSCALLATQSIPALENRTLRISPDLAGFEYQYEVCSNKVLGICTSHKMQKDLYDLNDKVLRKQLIDMGFVARVKEKIK